VTVLCALISPYAGAREAVRTMCRTFLEIYVATPIEECERRDPKGLYRRARRGELASFTGISDPYEPPSAPELTIDTNGLRLDEAVATVVALWEAHSAATPVVESDGPGR
jgi:adenylylsulfate kinase-like enzyme